ncbi:hypothetical protein GCM10023184_04640 [Flaviaesturariibacter amylovorans]|uniref:Type IX secretion system membrane protein PorP/SprF n=1 Tax=Flaviaesturariibacter amylovorans TaxID=1084520 RepID=A0ABP8G9I1_9BACT
MLLLPFLLVLLRAAAQLHPAQGASLYTRLSASSPRFADASSFAVNPAALAGRTQFSAALYGEYRFGLEALSAYQASAALPLAGGGAGALLQFGGGPDYSESTVGLAYARQLGSLLDVGVQFRYAAVRASGYGAAGGLTADAGLRLHLGERLHAGAWVHNPARVRLGKQGTERLPSAFGLGLTWERTGQWLMGAELRQEGGGPPALTAGLQFRVAGALRGRAGITTAGPVAYLGAGLRLRHLLLEVTATGHRYLGLTPGLLLLFPAQ